MGFEEMVVAIIGTVAGVGLLGFIIAKITGLIKSWIERNKGGYDEETFNRLAKAFMQHKKDTERRLQNLEAIVTDDDRPQKQIREPHETIEIEDTEDTEKAKNQNDDSDSKDENSNLKNMLRN